MSNKSGTDVIAVPKGGGALTGIGEKFAPDLFTGTGNYSVPIELPPGRNGFQPQLSLVYSTGNGNSPFGLGWALGIPGVTRKTSKGVPLYHDERDVFVLSGSEDLVPVQVDEKKTQYRPRTETGFARILHHHDNERGQDYWEVRSRDGTLSHYGTPRPEDAADDWIDPATVADPDKAGRRSAWKLTETRDTFGNRIEFDYIRDAQREEGPHRWDQVYLSEIRYVDYGDPAHPSFLVQVKFHYAPRPDPFSEYRSGFEVRTVQRCTGIEISTHAGTVKRVRTYHLTYFDDEALATPQDQLPANGVSLLAQIVVEGHDDARERSQKMPPLQFHYGAFEPKERTFEAVEGRELPSVSLASEHHELVDLFGNGLPDIIEMNGQVRYWRNLGGGRFDLPRTMRAAPAGIDLADVGVQLIDADGDGRADLVDSRAELTGYYSLSYQGEWERFHRWERAPSFTLEDPEVKLVDLDGDGVTDVVRSGTSFECYFNHPLLGWQDEATRRVVRRRLEDFPNVNFSDPRVKWADMTGDGLTDVVIVHAGRIDYWPSIGRGDFAPRVTMRNSPHFPYGYAPQRILIGDVDGDGLADMLYVDDGKVTLWLNRGGNSWSDAIEILGTPGVTDMDAVRLVDLLGTGVSGVLWSRDATTLPRNHMFFLDFTGSHKPYLLEQIDNGMGAVTNIGYAPSTKFYLEDLGTAEEWKTPLPFPVQVVARVESIDHFSKGKLTTEYRYHHGYWDGAEREFRGFGRVDQRDTEVIGDYNAQGLDRQGRDFQQVEPGHFSPPTETRSWFHLGPVGEEFGDWEQIDFSSEYWADDPQALGALSDLEATLEVLPTRRARRDAVRALRGRILRTELYACDESSCAERPYTVTERLPGIRTEVPPDAANDRPAVFFPHQVAERTTQWERGDDPMTQLAFTGEYDAYGQPGLQHSLAVPRGREYRQPAISVEPFLATCTLTAYTQSNDADHYIVDRVSHRTTYEIPNDGRRPGAGGPQPSALELWQLVVDGAVERPLERKTIGQTLNYYDGMDFEGLPLGEMGTQGALVRAEQLVLTEALLHDGFRSEGEVSSPPEEPPYLDRSGGAIAWTPDYPQAFRDRISQLAHPPANGTPVLGGYVYRVGDGIPEQGYFAVTIRRAYSGRGLVTAERDALGNETRIEYDGYEFLPSTVVDPIGLETKATYDERILQPKLVTDPNGNATQYHYTPLGLVESIAVLGKPGQNQGDTSDQPGTRFEYAFEAFLESGGQQPIHTHTTRRTHHVNETDIPLPDRDQVIETREYSDGFGRLLQTRALAEDVLFGSHEFGNDVLPADQAQNTTAVGRARDQDESPNVVVSGWQTYDNKGRVVEKYEPFFSTGWDYSPPIDSERGQKATLFYDPRGRVVRTLNSDGSEQLTVFGVPPDITDPQHYQPSPWESYAYDANDNAGRTPSADPHAAAYASHNDTPSSMVVDALGRTVEQVERNGPNPEADWYKTRQQYDIRGNLLEVWDQLDRLAFQHVYDLADHQLRTEQLDAGVSRSVFDAAGDIIEQRDSKGALILHAHDALRRPTHLWARDNAGAGERDPKLAAADALFLIPGLIRSRPAVTLRERIVYGDAADAELSEADAKARNLLGKPYAHYEEAGLLRFEAYDFKGNVTEKERQVIADAAILAVFDGAASNNWNVDAFRIDWQPPDGAGFDEHAGKLLDTTTAFRTSGHYDALSRIKWVDYPADVTGARKRLDPAYNRAGALEHVSLDGVTFVEQIAYNARGQRTLIAYGDRDSAEPGPRVMTRYAYDPKTFRLARLRTEKFTSPSDFTYASAGGTLQDIAYDYDLAGNLVSLHDVTPGSGAPAQPDRLDRVFGYDPLYRLISATGRECDTPPPSTLWDPGPRCHDVTKTRLYHQEYDYDPAGNLTQLAHHLVEGNGGSVPTRHYDLVPGTNRLEAMTVGSTKYVHQYDSAGNLSKENTERRFEWDHSNRMRIFRVQTQGAEPSVHSHYLYDAGGQRVKKLVRKQGGRVEVTLYIDGVFEYHRVVDGSSMDEHNTLHVLDNESRIATVRVGIDREDGTPDVKFHFGDHLDSSTVVVDQNGDWVNREEYAPFGETSFGSFSRKRYRFTGKERDEESGLTYHGARYCASWLARWASPDPVGITASLNLFAYVENNPLRLRDISGTQSKPTRGEQGERNALAAAPESMQMTLEAGGQEAGDVDNLALATSLLERWDRGECPSPRDMKTAWSIIRSWIREEEIPATGTGMIVEPANSLHAFKVRFVANTALVAAAIPGKKAETVGERLQDARIEVTQMREDNSPRGNVGSRSSESIVLRDAERYLWGRAGPITYQEKYGRSALEAVLTGPIHHALWETGKRYLGTLARTNPAKPHSALGGKGWFEAGLEDFLYQDYLVLNRTGRRPELMRPSLAP